MGLKLGPLPNHAWNTNLVLNSSTGLVSPQFNCRFDDFFETTRCSAPDVVTSTQWCFLTGLKHADRFVMLQNIEVAGPSHEEPHGTISSNDPIQFEANTDHASRPNSAQASEGDTPPSCDAGTSSCCCMCTMSRAMAESVEQQDFYG